MLWWTERSLSISWQMISSRCRLESAFNSSLAWSAAASMIALSIFILAYIRLFEYIVKTTSRSSTGERNLYAAEDIMAEVVVVGAGLSGTLMAYELLPQLRKGDRLTVV